MTVQLNIDCKSLLPELCSKLRLASSVVDKLYAAVMTKNIDRWDGGTVEPAVAQLLYIMVRYFRPQTVVEFGTNAGYSTSYIWSAIADEAKSNPDFGCSFKSFEIDPQIAELARSRNPDCAHSIITGDSNSWEVHDAINAMGTIDMAFIDSSHLYEETVGEISYLLSVMKPRMSIILFHDIYNTEVARAIRDSMKPGNAFYEFETQPNTGFGVLFA